MKKSLHILGALSFIAQITFAQVGIGTTDPNDLTELHLESTTQGVAFPRMTSAQRNAGLEDNDPSTGASQGCTTCETVGGVTNISVVKIGTTIFNLDDNTYEYWNGVTWSKFGSTTTGTGNSALSEIIAIDAYFSGTAVTIEWDDNCVSNGTCTGPESGLSYYNLAGAGGFKEGTDRVIVAFFNTVDANGDYAIDNRTQDVKDVKRFRFYDPALTSPPTTNLPSTARFYPDSDNGTYDFTFQFDAQYLGGIGGALFELEAWLGGDLIAYPLAPGTAGDEKYLVIPVNDGANNTTGADPRDPYFIDQKVLSKGSNGDIFPNITFSIRISSNPAIFANGISFTLASKSAGADLAITNIKALVTRIR